MLSPLVSNLIAIATLIPGALIPWRPGATRDGLFWSGMVLAAAGASLWSWTLLSGGWHAEFGSIVWVIVAASVTLYLPVAAFARQAWRLAPLLMPYLLSLAVFASVVRGEPRPLPTDAPAVWIDVHILVAILLFGLLTLAAVSSFAVFLQEKALKRKRPGPLTPLLPSVADAEHMAGWLLMGSEAVLGIGLMTGMAVEYFATGSLFRLDHKTLLAVSAFLLIGALLLGHRVCGVRGRMAARIVLLAYLLVILASPGVKFVSQVLL
jgi:ABC-type uncharacterized transport system permease subunit